MTETNAEIWKVIPNFPKYEASSHGQVRGPHGILKANGRVGSGKCYHAVCLRSANGKPVTVTIHRLVAWAFLGLRPADRPLVCHIDDNPDNNHVSNLRYDTAAGNSRDRIINGGSQIRLKIGLTPARAECLAALVRLCEERVPSLRELAPHLHGGQGTSQTAAWFLLRYLTRDGLVAKAPGARGYTPSEAGRAALGEWQEAHPHD